MKQTDNSIAAIKWWNGLSDDEKYHFSCKHFLGIPINTLMDKSIEAMYLYEHQAEHPSTKEAGNGMVGGEWYANGTLVQTNYDNDWHNIALCCYSDGEANAQRIVQCVNGYDKLKEELSFAMDLAHRENEMVKKLEADNEALVSALKDCIDFIVRYEDSDNGDDRDKARELNAKATKIIHSINQ